MSSAIDVKVSLFVSLKKFENNAIGAKMSKKATNSLPKKGSEAISVAIGKSKKILSSKILVFLMSKL
ncbi:MAG: hypothetical protein ACRDCC_07140 [Culicoidibacterales bacterium]